MQIKVFNPNYKSRIEKFLDHQYFMHELGFNLYLIKPGKTEGKMPLSKSHTQQKGLVHGGVVATIADIVAGFAAYTIVPKDHNVVTGEIKISYLNPGVGGELIAKGWVLKQGKKLNFCESEVWCYNHGKQMLIAKATATMVTLFPGELRPVE